MPYTFSVYTTDEPELIEDTSRKTATILHAVDLAIGTGGKNDQLARDHIHTLADWAISKQLKACVKVAWWCLREKIRRQFGITIECRGQSTFKICDNSAEPLFQEALSQVLENILDINTKPTLERSITIKIRFIPSESRESAKIIMDDAVIKLAPRRLENGESHIPPPLVVKPNRKGVDCP